MILSKINLIIIICFLIVFTGIFGFIIIVYGFNMSEYPEYESYLWVINTISRNGTPIDYSDFKIYHDFESNFGFIAFETDIPIYEIYIQFPKSIENNVSLKIDNDLNKNLETLNLNWSYEQKNNIVKVYFNQNYSEIPFIINYKIDLSPISSFDIHKNSFFSDGQLFFDFGKDYECLIEGCAKILFNFKNIRKESSPINSMHLRFINQSKNADPLFKFEISARSLKILNDKNSTIALGVALLSGSLFSLFSLIITFIFSIKEIDKGNIDKTECYSRFIDFLEGRLKIQGFSDKRIEKIKKQIGYNSS